MIIQTLEQYENKPQILSTKNRKLSADYQWKQNLRGSQSCAMQNHVRAVPGVDDLSLPIRVQNDVTVPTIKLTITLLFDRNSATALHSPDLKDGNKRHNCKNHIIRSKTEFRQPCTDIAAFSCDRISPLVSRCQSSDTLSISFQKMMYQLIHLLHKTNNCMTKCNCVYHSMMMPNNKPRGLSQRQTPTLCSSWQVYQQSYCMFILCILSTLFFLFWFGLHKRNVSLKLVK